MTNYYNEFDPFAAEWLRTLIKKGLIPDGEVDTRSIVDVRPDDLRSFTQCHFFAGIGGWSHALRLAGWPDDRQIWTGSCPCQPFSVAGKGKGKEDERHLWPVFFELIRQVRPPVIMGEQVSGKAGYGWFDGVASDLEGEGYSSRAVDIPACAVNAPHIRQRLYWVAQDMAQPNGDGYNGAVRDAPIASSDRPHDRLSVGSDSHLRGSVEDARCWKQQEPSNSKQMSVERNSEERAANTISGSSSFGVRSDDTITGAVEKPECEREGRRGIFRSSESVSQIEIRTSNKFGGRSSDNGDMADTERNGRQGSGSLGEPVYSASSRNGQANQSLNAGAGNSNMADANSGGCAGRPESQERRQEQGAAAERLGFWDDTEWLTGADGKTRRSQPGVRLLVNGLPNRVGRLRGYGNAIVPPLAAEVIKSFMETQ